MVTVSTATAGATDINVAATSPSAARPAVLIIGMIVSRIRRRAEELRAAVAQKKSLLPFLPCTSFN
jgi:hypothetical protein